MCVFLDVCNSKRKETWLRSWVYLWGFVGVLGVGGGAGLLVSLNAAAQC